MAVDPGPLWDYDDPVGSAGRFREAVASAEGDDRLVLMTQLARALGLQERYDDAHHVLDAVAAAGARAPEVGVRLALERGRVLRSAGDPAAAAPLFRAAADEARVAGLEALHVDALHMVALVSPAGEQLRINEEALAYARASSDPTARTWEASLLHNIGMCLVDAGDLDAALRAFREALGVRERLGRPAETRVARWAVGWTLRLLDRRSEALQIQESLAAELEAAGEQDPYVTEELVLLRRR